MGGYGSGKRIGEPQRPLKEESLSFSSTYLHQEEMINKEQSYEKPYTLTFSSNKTDRENTIGVYTQADQIRLEYTMTNKRAGEDEEVSYNVPVEWTECNFGGHRSWFICPGTGCGRRVEKLYKPPNQTYFACRHCHEITYHRCNISGKPVRVTMYKKKCVAEKLGEDNPDGSLWALKPTKPKGMHWDTYEDLIENWEYWNDLHHIQFINKSKELIGELENKYESIDSKLR